MSDQPSDPPPMLGQDGRPEAVGPPAPQEGPPDYARDPHSRARKGGWWRKP